MIYVVARVMSLVGGDGLPRTITMICATQMRFFSRRFRQTIAYQPSQTGHPPLLHRQLYRHKEDSNLAFTAGVAPTSGRYLPIRDGQN